MRIEEVKTAFKIADVSWDGKGPKLQFNYLPQIIDENGEVLPQTILTENVARVYLIVVDKEIYKIGGSQDKGGIKGTLRIYQDGGQNGRPSIRSYGIWYFLFDTISRGKKIEFYMIYQSNFEAEVKGLFGYHKVANASLNYKLLEECCEKDYREYENGEYPRWNVQEQAGDWPLEVKEEHSKIMNNSINRTLSQGRKVVNI